MSVAPAISSESRSQVIPFTKAGRLPEQCDNVAIAICRLEQGAIVTLDDRPVLISSTVLEGHRFAVEPIKAGAPLLSWGLPFGTALRDISPGEYVCNEKGLISVGARQINFKLPDSPNFIDARVSFSLDEATFVPGKQVERYERPATFMGFQRTGGRGVGVRNYVVVLGVSSLTGSLARAVAKRFESIRSRYPNIDGVVPVAHTEGGEPGAPNNLRITLRTLAGFFHHPNIAAIVAVDAGHEPVNNERLQQELRDGNHCLDLPHRFYSARGAFLDDVSAVAALVEAMLPEANAAVRSEVPLSGLKIGLQCGGSDAFSGISANPLIGILAREAVRHGGCASLAETDELIGAEPYILRSVRDAGTARRFLQMLEAFEERVGWHGFTSEGNPSAGNIYRGLYNIVVKSIGAARKKDPSVRLDYVIEYGEPMPAPGFYFMDSPGNDLESIAGQVASGCNLILFATGNGSITNFPFVPTIKVMTTTGRFNLLAHDMDVNAGRYSDGESMESLGLEAFAQLLRVISGERTAGERAGHSQAQLWRNWRQTSGASAAALRQSERTPTGLPLTLKAGAPAAHIVLPERRKTIRLILPTSLCSSHVAAGIARKLNDAASEGGMQFVALPHTEGCAVSAADNEEIYYRVMSGYLRHPRVEGALLLEHGCEKTHNDSMRHSLRAAGLQPEQFGWASIQLDGGIERVTDKVGSYFVQRPASLCHVDHERTVAITSSGEVSTVPLEALALVIASLLKAGVTVVVPCNASFIQAEFLRTFVDNFTSDASIAFGERPRQRGLHLMATPTAHAVETLTGLGATGAELILHVAADRVWQGHPFIPTLQIGERGCTTGLDIEWSAVMSPAQIAQTVLEKITETLRDAYVPRTARDGNTDFQLTRGHFGVSL